MYNLPNFLSLARILLIPILIILLINGAFGGALLIFILAALTDAADGMLARLMHQRTIIGSYLDPIADKLLSGSSYICLAILGFIPGWLAVLVISRDVIILGGLLILFITSRIPKIQPTFASKITTFLQLLTIVLVLFAQIASFAPLLLKVFIWATGAFTIYSGLQYVKKGIEIIGQETPK
ncbi:MAG: CDP-alcohol phosphatidyltransferase family protein [Thermodesulfobacteriota bacterium]